MKNKYTFLIVMIVGYDLCSRLSSLSTLHLPLGVWRILTYIPEIIFLFLLAIWVIKDAGKNKIESPVVWGVCALILPRFVGVAYLLVKVLKLSADNYENDREERKGDRDKKYIY